VKFKNIPEAETKKIMNIRSNKFAHTKLNMKDKMKPIDSVISFEIKLYCIIPSK
jgi:hypothetical protein